MKKIDAIIRTARFYAVKEALDEAGVKGMTVYEIKGVGAQRGDTSSGGRPGTFKNTELIPKTKIEIVCDDEDTEKIISAVTKSAQTGDVGDGKIFVSTIDDVIRIRTGEKGASAV